MRGVLKGVENVRRLSAYIEGLVQERRGLPARDGKPNLSVIAEACGFDRGVFYTNEAAKLILDEATTRLGLDSDRAVPKTAFEETRIRAEVKARSDVRTRSLEDEVIRLRAENAKLRAENDRLGAIRKFMAETGRLP